MNNKKGSEEPQNLGNMLGAGNEFGSQNGVNQCETSHTVINHTEEAAKGIDMQLTLDEVKIVSSEEMPFGVRLHVESKDTFSLLNNSSYGTPEESLSALRMSVTSHERASTAVNSFSLTSMDLRLFSSFEVKKNKPYGDPYFGVKGHGSEYFDAELRLNMFNKSNGQALVLVVLLRETHIA